MSSGDAAELDQFVLQPAGWFYRLENGLLGLMGEGEACRSELGEGLLDLLGRNGKVPLSISFRESLCRSVEHGLLRREVERAADVRLSNVAVTHHGAYADAYLRRYDAG
jgi:hypothetical protein